MKTNQINPQKQKTFREMYPWEISENETSPKLLWVKKVTSVNKYRADKNTLRTDENNFNGPYINIDTPENWQEGDVFLICSMSSYESKNRTFRVFQYMDGQLHSIVQMDETYDWPTLLFSTVGSLNYELYLDGICCQDFYTFVEANLENCHGNTFEEIITELRNEYPDDMPCKDRFDEYLELLEDKLYENIERRTD